MEKRFVVCILLLSFQVLNAQTPQFIWRNVAIGGGGFVSSIVADFNEQNLFYARTDVGGAYRWDNASAKWISMMDWIDATERGLLGIEAIAVDPKTPGKVYMMAGTSYWNDGKTAFLRSSNRGNTWEKIYVTESFTAHGNGMGRGNGEALAIDPNNSNIMFYGSRNKGLFKSTNNGNSWSKVAGFRTAAGSDTTWNGSGFSFVTFAPNSSSVLYAGFLRANNNVFRSTDGGTTWSVIPNRPKPQTNGAYTPPLMPQRIAIAPNGSVLYITFGDGAGPHTMQWDEGWGAINDWFNRGAVLKYETASETWSDVSPENFIDPGDSKYNAPSEYIACYGGISINQSNPQELVVSSIGYRGPQFWKLPGTGNSWSDQWGSNIYHSKDGGQSWAPSFQYYSIGDGNYPTVEQMSENGIGWMFNNSIHWSGSVVFDPFNSNKVWVTSGNGIFATSNIKDYTRDSSESWNIKLIQNTLWKVMSHGIEETVPGEVVSIPGGPLVSAILDYDGFRHDDIAKYPSNRHLTDVSGEKVSLGNTRALAYAPKSGKLVKVSDERVYKAQYNDIPISPLQFSSDKGTTWSVVTYPSGAPNSNLSGGMSVAISTDGEVVLWTPLKGATEGNQIVQRYATAWSTVSGIDGSYIVGDPENANVFYAYNRKSGKMLKSTNKGISFSEVSSPGTSDFHKFRLVPNKEGDIWLPLTEKGLVRSKDGGANFSPISTVSHCEAVGFGKAAEGKTFPTVFIFGTVGNTTGVFMSTDEGESWIRANDDEHEYGGLANGEFVIGDMNVYGRVYMSTAGRGIVYGEISSNSPTPIANHSPLATNHSPIYYTIKGEPLGNAKPQKAGIYIVKQGNSIQKITVR
jgi:photosystem II stability/assembly factor-like uncharacterized protein